MFYRYLIRPLLFSLSQRDPEVAHERVLNLLENIGQHEMLLKSIESFSAVKNIHLRQTIFGLRFDNPLGLAAGFTKDGLGIEALSALGFGFLELGTVTPKLQEGNPRPRMFRLPADQALINRMGFNNLGVDALAERLKKHPFHKVPLGISIGKGKDTPLEIAVEDYLYCFQKAYFHADYFAINVSSPNTLNLRQLQDKDFLLELLRRLDAGRQAMARKWPKRKPILVKVAPDLSETALGELLDVCDMVGVDGIIATNTTTTRDGLTEQVDETGGLSGKPLFTKSWEMVRYIRKAMPKMPIIAVGGISSPEGAVAMWDAGANLLQLYTAFIYQGPSLPRIINRGILETMRERGAVKL